MSNKLLLKIYLITFKIKSQDCVYIKLIAKACSLYYLQRITLEEIKNHLWFFKESSKGANWINSIRYHRGNSSFSIQSVEEIVKIMGEARDPPLVSRLVKGFGWEDKKKGKIMWMQRWRQRRMKKMTITSESKGFLQVEKFKSIKQYFLVYLFKNLASLIFYINWRCHFFNEILAYASMNWYIVR